MRTLSRDISIASVVVALLGTAAPAEAASGVWERAWGKAVDSVAAGSGPEICVIAINCQAGLSSTAAGGEFNSPAGVATDAAGNVYVADGSNNRVQKFDANGSFLRMWGRNVTSAGPDETGAGFEVCVATVDACQAASTGGLAGEMNNPRGVAVDGQGNVYVSETSNNRVQKFTTAGTFLLAWGKDVASSGPGNTGTGFEVCNAGVDTCKAGGAGGNPGGELFQPKGLAVDAAGSVYVVDSFNDRVQKFDATGGFLRLWGTDVAASGPDNTGTGFEICTVAANCKFAGGGAGAAGDLHHPSAIAVDPAGDVYVTQVFPEQRVQKFSSSGAPLRLWGKDVVSGGPGNTGTGPEICVPAVDTCKSGPDPAALGGEFADPAGLATDAAGAVYVSDSGAHRIQEFDSSGNFVRTWGQDVAGAGPGNTGTGFEICVAVADTCKAGDNGSPSLGGQMIGPSGLATDSTGNLYVADATNARVQKFTADPLPETTIATGPASFATASPTFEFSSSEGGSTFECRLDGASFTVCTTPLTTGPLADRSHELEVRAVDPARQADATPASRTFTVDTVAPDTRIDSGPPAGATTADVTPTFGFSSSEADSTFECRFDAEPFGACSGPGSEHTSEALPVGPHTFVVRSTDAVGNVDATPAAGQFTVDADPPETTITKQPMGNLKHGKSATYEFSSNEPGSTFLCSLDGKAQAACSSPLKLTKLKKGKHSVQVTAVDPAGNVDQTPATDTFRVLRHKPRRA